MFGIREFPTPFNAVMHLSSRHVGSKVDALINQAASNYPISFWVHLGNRADGLVEILKERNFIPIITCPLMAWTVKPISKSIADIRPANMEVFNKIVSTVYQFDEAIERGFKKLMNQIDSENYIIYADGLPVGQSLFSSMDPLGGFLTMALFRN